jgi:hypothetical protein
VFVGYAVNRTDDIYWLLNEKQKTSLNQEISCGKIKLMDPGLNQRMIQVLMMIQTVKLMI